MQIINYTSQEATLYLSHKELNILKGAIIVVRQKISIYEFNLRMEASIEEIEVFKNFINRLINQKKHENNIKKTFCFQEIIIINNLLNEICNGFKVDNFESRIGASFAEADDFSKLISTLGKKMYLMQNSLK